MMRTVAVLNQKGGVGKTTVTLGLASAGAVAGQRVLIVDLDPQGASSWVLGRDAETEGATLADLLASEPTTAAVRDAIMPSAWSPAIGLLAADARLQDFESGSIRRLRRLIDRVADDFDAVLIDCPPSLGTLTRSALTAARHAVVVVEPSALGLRGIGGVADAIDEVWDRDNPELELSGVILNRVPAISAEAERRIDELVRIVGRGTIWKPAVPQRVILNQAVGERRPIHAYGSRAGEPIDAFDRLWQRLRTLLRSRAG